MTEAPPGNPATQHGAPAHLAVDDLACSRGDRRLFSNLHLELTAGQLLHVTGPNGCGKTTLLRSLCTLFEPQEGEIRWNGENVRKLGEEYCREVIYLGHLNGIKNELTGAENLHIAATLDGARLSQDQVWDALERIGLAGYEELPVKVLSQGQKRRVALARLLLSAACIWVLDEPFTALDVAAVELMGTLIDSHLDSGGLVILTTHQEATFGAGRTQLLELGD